MLIPGQTTEERIAQIADRFGHGFHNFQQGQNAQRARALQEEARKRQEAMQALEVSNSIAGQTGKFVDPGQVAPLLSRGSFEGLNDILASAPMTKKAELEAQDRASKKEMDALNKQVLQGKVNELNTPYGQTAKGLKEQEDKKFQSIDNLRKEVTSLPATKSLVEIDTALAKINSAPKSAAGDITRVFSFMKLNDPNSTVREGEYATAQNAAGVPERIRAAYNNTLSGQVLTPVQRKDFETAALSLAKSQYQTYKAYTEPQRKRIAELDLDASQIFPTFSQQALYEGQTQPPGTDPEREELERLRALKNSRLAGGQ